ncbi:DUF6493 family protein [Streptosporangium saharense]|uniref:DUF7824 domain-containing protein n=1 Tax=Streptosporangium saharense TaxID=1706840 RepID=A0A7W7VR25_9ACTN|nr:DUF6493 family protein [Streptosporangium saharense]MBB4918885.1 hypothetical protein [Streptosporangium saharense]
MARRLPEFLDEVRQVAVERVRAKQGEPQPWEEREAVGDVLLPLGPSLRIVGVGTISGAAAAVAWLTRREFAVRWGPQLEPGHLVTALAGRPEAWRADVAARLAKKIRRANDPIAPLALALLRAVQGEPPNHDPLVVAWLFAGVVDDDPLVGPLLPRIFEAQGAGRTLMEERATPTPTPWLALFKQLLADGRLSRAEVIDGCVSRFLRGGDAVDLRFFVRLHELLAPEPHEVAARTRDYLRLLPTAPSTVATLALDQVRRSGPHDEADVAEAVDALIFRSETKLAEAGLRWLDQEVRRAPTLVGETASALATAFAHTSYDVQRRAARIAVKHAAAFEAGAAVITEAVGLLPAELGAQVAAVFGGEVAEPEAPEPFVPVALPVVEKPGPFPAPSLEVNEWDLHDWVKSEQWLAAFVEQAGGDRTALRARLEPVFGDVFSQLHEMKRWRDAPQWIAALAKEVIASGSDPDVPEGTGFSVTGEKETDVPGRAFTDLTKQVWNNLFRQISKLGASEELVAAVRDGLPASPPERVERRLPDPRSVSGPHMFLLRRLSELYVALREGTLPPVLLATPTSMTGHLSPDVLIERLEICAAAGVEPLSADLQQALLRLPRRRDAEAAERAARVGSRAAASVATWLAEGGLPDPETGLKWGYGKHARDHDFREDELRYEATARLIPVLRAKPTGHDLIDELLREPSSRRGDGHGYAVDWWPATLPSHREVVAVNYLPHLLYQWNRAGVYPAHLVALTQANGPVGEATALVLAYFLAAERQEAVRSLLLMAAREDLDGEAVGRQLGYLVRRTWFETRPLLKVLTEAAHQGAHEQVWEILRVMTPMLLPDEGERPTVVHSELVAFTADLAVRTGAKGEIPAVTAHAARGGRSRFVRECARLRDLLG